MSFVQEVERTAVSADLDGDGELVLGRLSYEHSAWHVVRLDHRRRTFGATEASCE